MKAWRRCQWVTAAASVADSRVPRVGAFGWADDPWGRAAGAIGHARASRAPADGEEVGRQTEERGLGLHRTRRVQDVRALGVVGPAAREVGEGPRRPLHLQQRLQGEARLPELRRELLRSMEEAGGEKVASGRVPVLAVSEIAGDDGPKLGIAQES